MTRLTDAQIDEVWYATPNLRGFVDAIAALAVQEVEREVVKWQEAHALECHARNHAEAALAEVTKERDALIKAVAQDVKRIEAALATAKREALTKCANALTPKWGTNSAVFDIVCFRDREYPATPSGELCDADCGCPSPEAREVPSDIVLPVEESVNGRWMWRNDFRAIITPADAKRIVRLAQEAE
jgi:hypothetical protein